MLFTITEPFSIFTLPVILLLLSTLPHMSYLIYSSRTILFAVKISSFFPVSSHHAFKISLLTLQPMSINSWIASVISSSFRQDGFILSIASWILGEKIYTPTRAKLLGGCFGFSMSLTTFPFASRTATPKAHGFSTFLSKISASSLSRLNFSTSLFIALGSRGRLYL